MFPAHVVHVTVPLVPTSSSVSIIVPGTLAIGARWGSSVSGDLLYFSSGGRMDA